MLDYPCDASLEIRPVFPEGINPSILSHLDPITTNNATKLTKLVTIKGFYTPRRSITFSMDQLLLAAGGSTVRDSGSGSTLSCADIWFWNMQQDHAQIISFSNQSIGVESIHFSPDSGYMLTSEIGRISGGYGYTLKLWDTKTLSSQVLLENSITPTVGAFSPDNRYLVYGSENGFYLRKLQDGSISPLFTGSRFAPGEPAISSDSNLIAAVTDDGHLRVWDIKQNKSDDILLSEKLEEPLLRFTSNNQRLIVADIRSATNSRSNVEVWTIGGQLVRLSPTMVADVLALYENDQLLTIVGREGRLITWQIDTGTVKSDTLLDAFSPDMNVPLWISASLVSPLAANVSQHDGTLNLWDLENTQVLKTIEDNTDHSRGGAPEFNPQGNMLIVFVGGLGPDQGIEIWGVPS